MSGPVDPEERPLVRWARHLVFAVLLVSIPFVEWIMVRNLRDALRSNSWPTTEGKVTKSEVTWDVRRARPVYSPEVAYEYRADGKAYQGTAVRVGHLTTNVLRDAEKVVAQFPVGKTVPVHYDPANPSSCCLITGTDWPHYVVVVAPVVFWVACVAYFYQMWKNRAESRAGSAGQD